MAQEDGEEKESKVKILLPIQLVNGKNRKAERMFAGHLKEKAKKKKKGLIPYFELCVLLYHPIVAFILRQIGFQMSLLIRCYQHSYGHHRSF